MAEYDTLFGREKIPNNKRLVLSQDGTSAFKGQKLAKKKRAEFQAHSSFRDAPFLRGKALSRACFLVKPKRLSNQRHAMMKSCDCPPHRAMKRSTRGDPQRRYTRRSIATDRSQRDDQDDTISTIVSAPIIVARDAHEEASDMRRPQRYNQLIF